MDILRYLVSEGLLEDKAIAELSPLIESREETVESALLAAGVDAKTVSGWLAGYYQVPAFFINEDFSINQEVLNYIPEESSLHYQIIPLGVEDGVLQVGTNNPDNLQIREVLNFISTKYNLPFKIYYISSADLRRAQSFYANLKGDVSDALVSLEDQLDADIKAKQAESRGDKVPEMEHIKEDAPITKIVATILRYAVDAKASDIHIQPADDKVLVRYRLDGALTTSLELPNNTKNAVIARIKILTSTRLDEKRKPQDGRFSATFDGRQIDFRVSFLPTTNGEKVVMRILDVSEGVSRLEDIGVRKAHIDLIRSVTKEPYGIVLISGPTGSGKSTTLRAMLHEVDKLSKNVVSLEDPVEYNIEGVSQSQVRPEIGYTFANGLRAILRQDPDIIMVGEIRDKETAQLAIQAALTGHLVFSTIHTNNAIGVVPRLVDMGVDPYLIAPTLKLAMAQRLARRIKPGTGQEEPINTATRHLIDRAFATLPAKYRDVIPAGNTLLKPVASPGSESGLKGRIAVMETLEITDAIQELILSGASEERIYEVARSQGFVSMQEDAIIKALDHQIPYEEMTAFGTQIGLEASYDEVEESVDNQTEQVAAQAIIDINEDIVS